LSTSPLAIIILGRRAFNRRPPTAGRSGQPSPAPREEVDIIETKNRLLIIDGAVNLALGAALMLFPSETQKLLGLPRSSTPFYASLLGAVLFGIGLALGMERFAGPARLRGLGLGGAIVINICGAAVLMIWLATRRLDIPVRGVLILWTVAAVVLLVALAEIATIARKGP
jgi:hypothetical protein